MVEAMGNGNNEAKEKVPNERGAQPEGFDRRKKSGVKGAEDIKILRVPWGGGPRLDTSFKNIPPVPPEITAKMNADREAYRRLKDEIKFINDAVSQSTTLDPKFGERFGVDFKSDRRATDEWIAKRVLEKEAKINSF